MNESTDMDDCKTEGMPSKEEIERRLTLNGSDPAKLVITPLINPLKQVEDGTVDLRLGTEFVLAKRSKFATLDAIDQKGNIDLKILEYQEKTYVKMAAV